MRTLNKTLDSFDFVEREKINGRIISNKCGRDFLYYALNFYYPEKFNARNNNPVELDKNRDFGQPVSKWFAWTQIQFFRVSPFLAKHGLELYINNNKITSYPKFVLVNLAITNIFSKSTCDSAIEQIENFIDSNVACAIDIGLGRRLMNLLDHVMFVYGYDEENLYVFDTNTVKQLEYERIDDKVHYYKLPKNVVRKRWSVFGRVWKVIKI